MLKTAIKNIYIIVILLILNGCGYHLRGLNQDNLIIKEIAIDSSKIPHNYINKLLIHNLSNKLISRNITIVSKTDKKPKNTLELINSDYSKMIISKGSSNLVTQYKIVFNIKFNFFIDDKLVLSDQNITTQRNYNYTQDQILGLEDEQNIITQEIIQDVSDKVINQLSIATQ